ncbi:aminoacyl-tRNA hydrolase [Leptothoe spongobia]|uniref:Peptidyl-tRNA hydrolase n=1 Tax=Leptothoe spongobia TAU-MAC 1115 TaxID=1967444 RepID=A0A947DBP5_9CYAN|nr:aminoacyl-tRNA hydrolase [Leptothoe spongobia TAU-MAC 1115]
MTDADSPQTPKLLVGLGNPGQKYDRTRHNIGFEVIDALAKAWSIPMSNNKRFQGITGESRTAAGNRLILLKPTTYMNRSGQSIRAIVDWYKLSPSDVLVIYDDMDLPIGKLRLRLSGSAGGHNGMKSIISHLGTQIFPRLRLGISRSDNPETQSNRTVVNHVLGKFAPDERKVIDAAIQLAEEAVEFSLSKGIERAMSLYNGREAAA